MEFESIKEALEIMAGINDYHNPLPIVHESEEHIDDPKVVAKLGHPMTIRELQEENFDIVTYLCNILGMNDVLAKQAGKDEE